MSPDYIEDKFDEDDIIEESPEYSPKSDFNKAKLADDAVRKCIEVRGQEMKAGFWNTKLTRDGQPIREWISDSRKAFISTVKALRSLLSPETKRDKRFPAIEEKILTKLKELYTEYAYEEWAITYVNDPKVYGGTAIFKKTGKVFIPEVGSEVNIQINPFNRQMTPVKGGWDTKINAYWDSILEVYDEFFSHMIDLCDRNNYFKQQLVYG